MGVHLIGVHLIGVHLTCGGISHIHAAILYIDVRYIPIYETRYEAIWDF
jgi:SLT domain-containing protein